MTDIRVRGTTEPDEIAVVLALLRRDCATMPRPVGVQAWRDARRAALATGNPRATGR